MKKELKDKKLLKKGTTMTEKDLCENCITCLATKYCLRFGRYPDSKELGKFMRSEREKSTKC